MTTRLPILDTFTPEAVLLALDPGPKQDVLRQIVEHAVACKALPRGRRQQVLDLLVEREERGSTGLGRGIAVPHAKVPGLKRPAAVVARAPEGLDFRAVDGEPVYALIMLVSPESRADEHLATLRWISVSARDPDFLSFIRQAASAEDVIEVFQERAP